MAKDPICGMEINAEKSLKIKKEGIEYYFCSTHCRDKFIKKEGLSPETCLPAQRIVFYKNKIFITSSFAIAVILLSYFFPAMAVFRLVFLTYVKRIWWAVLLGLFLGGIIDYYIPQEYISKILSKKTPKTIINSVFLGFLMSACSHGILALSIQLHKKGASGPAVVSFLLASPWANFTITIMLIGFFGFKALFIILAAVLVAINTGFIFLFLEKKGLIEKNMNTVEISKDFSIIKDFKARAKNYNFKLNSLFKDSAGIIKGSIALSKMVLWWIILGILIASFAGAFIPVHIFHKFMGPTILGLLVTLGLATIIEVCSEGSSPLAFEIYRTTHALGNSFVFLMAGVATDYTEIGLIWANIGKKTALWLPIVTVPQILIIGSILNIIFK